MKRFAISVLSIVVFFVGLGSLAEQVGAKFKSDEKALDIIRKARTAIGGDAAIAEVRGLVITGRTTNNFLVDGAERSEQGETEIALQLPDKLMRTVKIGREDGTGAKATSQQHDVMIVTKDGHGNLEAHPMASGEVAIAGGNQIILKERVVDGDAAVSGSGERKVFVRRMGDGENGEIRVVQGANVDLDRKDMEIERSSAAPRARTGVKQNELLRLSLALLVTAPEGIDVSYTFAGETDVDGVAVNIVNAEFGGANYKLYIAKSSNLPVAMSYVGFPTPTVLRFAKAEGVPSDAPRAAVAFTKTIDPSPAVEHMVKFSDYRSAGNVQLPYRWTTSVGGVTKETFDITSYNVNPANLADRFQNQKTYFRVKSPDGQ